MAKHVEHGTDKSSAQNEAMNQFKDVVRGDGKWFILAGRQEPNGKWTVHETTWGTDPKELAVGLQAVQELLEPKLPKVEQEPEPLPLADFCKSVEPALQNLEGVPAAVPVCCGVPVVE